MGNNLGKSSLTCFSLAILLSLFLTFGLSSRYPQHAIAESTSAFPAQRSYWVWAGRSVSSGLPLADILYLHQGTLERPHGSISQPRFVAQGASPVRLGGKGLILVFRIEALTAEAQIIRRAKLLAEQWSARGNSVLGIQIDYDSPTQRLPEYVEYLRKIRLGLPKGLSLGVTGLADWAANSPQASLEEVAKVSDEIIFQLYNGSNPLPKFESYLGRLPRVNFPFRLGLLEGQTIPLGVEARLRENVHYRGVVYFLLPRKT